MDDERVSVADPEATPDDVAALLTARTKDAAGRELGTWTDDTRPTREQVQLRIEIARSLLRADLGGTIPDPCREGFEAVVALYAALLTEAAFWPEQTQSNQSTYERLRDLFQQARDGVESCVAGGDPLAPGAGEAYDLDISGGACVPWPDDWWQRDLENPISWRDSVRAGRPV